MSNISKRRREGTRTKIKSVGDHKEFLNRITKTLYYGQLPMLPCLSLPVTEISCAVWSEAQRGRSLRRLHADAAAGIARQACVSPCALVLALLYLERLNACNPDYLANAPPQDLFLVSLMVGNKFLQDDGEDDEVICSEWAESGGIDLKQLKTLEIEFLNAIDWNIYVSDKSFEAGLSRLERRVAIKQAQARGFFTYADLVAACDRSAAAELVRAAAACVALALGYVSGLLALLTSTLVVSQAWLPALQLAAPLASFARTDVTAPAFPTNATAERASDHPLTMDRLAVDPFANEVEVTERLRCCAEWARHRDLTEPRRVRHDAAAEPARKAEAWSTSSVWHWVYRSAAADPVRRWLERVDEYAELARRGWSAGAPRLCAGRWLDLTRLSAVMATVSDR